MRMEHTAMMVGWHGDPKVNLEILVTRDQI
jgi:hypothetical protein